MPGAGPGNNAINFAVLSAEQLGHTYVGSEHLLLGLLREEGGVAAILLGQKGVAYGDLLGSSVHSSPPKRAL